MSAGISDGKFNLILMSINVFSFSTIDAVFAISANAFTNFLYFHNRSGHFKGTTTRFSKAAIVKFRSKLE